MAAQPLLPELSSAHAHATHTHPSLTSLQKLPFLKSTLRVLYENTQEGTGVKQPAPSRLAARQAQPKQGSHEREPEGGSVGLKCRLKPFRS